MSNVANIRIENCQWLEQKNQISSIREQVFIQEQHVPFELEWDGEDESSYHLLAFIDDTPVGTARLLASGQIGRMSVLKNHRQQGIGKALLKSAEELAKSNAMTNVFLHAQSYIKHFYQSQGYTARGKEFMDAGIPHVEMTKKL